MAAISSVPSSSSPPPSLRAFQAEVLALARARNVVMVGATGIGKTFVAIALLSELDYGNGARAVFMAPTRQLVWQITAKIRASSSLRARAYCGTALDVWGAADWTQELALCQVLVATPEVIRNVLERGYLRMEQVNLLVFDECHHVTKRHPYAQVLKLYNAHVRRLTEEEAGGEEEREETGEGEEDEDGRRGPLIFGTTACPTRHCAAHLHAILHRVELAERDTQAYAAAAPLLLETYPSSPNTTDVSASRQGEQEEDGDEQGEDEGELTLRTCRDALSAELLQELEAVRVVPVVLKLLRKSARHAAQDPERRKRDLRRFLLACASIHETLGTWCLLKLLELEVARLAANASLLVYVPGTMYGFDRDAVVTLNLVRKRMESCGLIATARVAKVEALLNERWRVEAEENQAEKLDQGEGEEEEEEENVSDMGSEEDDETELREEAEEEEKLLQGIIFVTTRLECRLLCEYLNQKLAHLQTTTTHTEQLRGGMMEEMEEITWPPFACVLGQAGVRDTAAHEVPSTETTLTAFERGALRFLVSTAVSVEGVDFPQCGLVIVTDRVASARQLIQLRGRARHQDGVVYYLAEEEDVLHHAHFHSLVRHGVAIKELDFTHDKVETAQQQSRVQAARARAEAEAQERAWAGDTGEEEEGADDQMKPGAGGEAVDEADAAAEPVAEDGEDTDEDDELGHPSSPQQAALERLLTDGTLHIPSTGAVVDLDSSVGCINRFVQSLPVTMFTVDYKTLYTFHEEEPPRNRMGRTTSTLSGLQARSNSGRMMYSATLQLPVELEVKPLVGRAHPSKAAAKAEVALIGCLRLLKDGLLDASLNSVYRKSKTRSTGVGHNLDYFLNRLHI